MKLHATQRRKSLAWILLAVLAVACGRTPTEVTPESRPTVQSNVQPTGQPTVSTVRSTPSMASATAVAATSYPYTVSDDAGRTTTILAEPKRVVSGAPSTTEIMFSLGLGSRLVGVTQYCDFPEEAKTKPQIGGLKPSLEAIVGLQPDLVLAVRGFPADVVAQLEQQKIPVLFLNPADFSGILSNITTVGAVMNATRPAKDLVASMQTRWDTVAAKARGATFKPRVMYEIDASDPGAVSVAGQGTFIDAMIVTSGGINIVAQIAPGKQYPKISAEAVLAGAPELMILGDAPYGQSSAQVASRPGWDVVPAVASGKVIEFGQREVDVTSRPGPRIVDGLEVIAKALHPELFR